MMTSQKQISIFTEEELTYLPGGFPCQPYSSAGQRKGKEDERHLWPEMLRAIREIQPTWIVGENVLGLVNWNGGMVFDEVQADLENEGYEVTPFLLPACAVNAPHRRDRVWFVAYSNSCANRRTSGQNESKGREERLSEWNEIWEPTFTSEVFGTFSNPNNERPQRSENNGSIGKSRKDGNKFITGLLPSNWEKFPTQSPICNGNDGIPSELDGITVSKWKQESIKAGGNAIVPQVALQIFKAIQAHEVMLSEA